MSRVAELVATSRLKIGIASNSREGSSLASGTSRQEIIRLFYVGSHFYKYRFMFYVYILESVPSGRFYIGYSENPDRRLVEHNSGKVKSTRPYRPWKKIYAEQYLTEIEAIRREREIKSKKSRQYILELIGL